VKQRGLTILENARTGELLSRYVPEAVLRALPDVRRAASYICTAAVP